MSGNKILVGLATGLWMSVLAIGTAAASDAEYTLVIKEHNFEPRELILPPGQKVKVWVDNQDKTPEEFESYELNREKIIAGGQKAAIFFGPLKPGTYKYFGEFHQATAQGLITVKE